MPTHYPLPQSCASEGGKLLDDAALPLEAPRLPFSLVKRLLEDDQLLLDDAALPLELHRLFFSAVKNLLEDYHLLLEVHRLLFFAMKKLLEVDLPLSGILPQQFVGPTIFLAKQFIHNLQMQTKKARTSDSQQQCAVCSKPDTSTPISRLFFRQLYTTDD